MSKLSRPSVSTLQGTESPIHPRMRSPKDSRHSRKISRLSKPTMQNLMCFIKWNWISSQICHTPKNPWSPSLNPLVSTTTWRTSLRIKLFQSQWTGTFQEGWIQFTISLPATPTGLSHLLRLSRQHSPLRTMHQPAITEFQLISWSIVTLRTPDAWVDGLLAPGNSSARMDISLPKTTTIPHSKASRDSAPHGKENLLTNLLLLSRAASTWCSTSTLPKLSLLFSH